MVELIKIFKDFQYPRTKWFFKNYRKRILCHIIKQVATLALLVLTLCPGWGRRVYTLFPRNISFFYNFIMCCVVLIELYSNVSHFLKWTLRSKLSKIWPKNWRTLNIYWLEIVKRNYRPLKLKLLPTSTLDTWSWIVTLYLVFDDLMHNAQINHLIRFMMSSNISLSKRHVYCQLFVLFIFNFLKVDNKMLINVNFPT